MPAPSSFMFYTKKTMHYTQLAFDYPMIALKTGVKNAHLQ